MKKYTNVRQAPRDVHLHVVAPIGFCARSHRKAQQTCLLRKRRTPHMSPGTVQQVRHERLTKNSLCSLGVHMLSDVALCTVQLAASPASCKFSESSRCRPQWSSHNATFARILPDVCTAISTASSFLCVSPGRTQSKPSKAQVWMSSIRGEPAKGYPCALLHVGVTSYVPPRSTEVARVLAK